MDVQLIIQFAKRQLSPLTLENRKIAEMKSIIRKYRHIIICRDVDEWALHCKPFDDIRHQFQIGHLQTLRYISIPRYEVEPSNAFVEGFIKAAEKKRQSYKHYDFKE